MDEINKTAGNVGKKEEQPKMSNPFNNVSRSTRSAVNIKRDFYTMATVDEDEAEIVMYGEIVQERPRDWLTDEPLDGDYIVLDEFLDDLKQITNVNRITIRLNSVGGDAYAAIPIHNRLRELKAHKTSIVDGVAMSGGSLIMCAGDTVKVNPSSLVMIHKCWCALFGGFNADELKKYAASNDAVDKAQAAIYRRKTGLGEEDILTMMADETYMTGAEAIEKGFADELMEGNAPDIAASADLSTLYVNGRALRLSTPLSNLPESIPTVKSDVKPPVKANSSIPTTPISEFLKQLEDKARAAASGHGSVDTVLAAEHRRLKEIEEAVDRGVAAFKQKSGYNK